MCTHRDPFTLLLSHGNAEGRLSVHVSWLIFIADIGEMVLWVKKLSAILRVNIMIYDYSGYGLNEPWGQDHCSEEVYS